MVEETVMLGDSSVTGKREDLIPDAQHTCTRHSHPDFYTSVGKQERPIPIAHWPARLTMRNPVSNTKVENNLRRHLIVTSGFHTHLTYPIPTLHIHLPTPQKETEKEIKGQNTKMHSI